MSIRDKKINFTPLSVFFKFIFDRRTSNVLFKLIIRKSSIRNQTAHIFSTVKFFYDSPFIKFLSMTVTSVGYNARFRCFVPLTFGPCEASILKVFSQHFRTGLLALPLTAIAGVSLNGCDYFLVRPSDKATDNGRRKRSNVPVGRGFPME